MSNNAEPIMPLPWRLEGLELFAADGRWITTFNTGNGKRTAEAELSVLAANTHEELSRQVSALSIEYHSLKKHALSFKECQDARCIGNRETILKSEVKSNG